MRLGVLVLVAGALALSACAKDEKVKDDGVDNGMCTQATIDAYNNIITRGMWKSDGENTVAASCGKIQDLLKGRSCKAQKVSTGEENNISYASVQSICEPKTKSSVSGTDVTPRDRSSKYVGQDGRCNDLYDRDVRTLRQTLTKAIQRKDKEYADSAKAMCVVIEYNLAGKSCKAYDSKKQEFVSNSMTSGDLGMLCDGAKKVALRNRR